MQDLQIIITLKTYMRDAFLIRSNIMENLKKIRLKIFNLTEFCYKANISSNNFVNWALQNYSDT